VGCGCCLTTSSPQAGRLRGVRARCAPTPERAWITRHTRTQQTTTPALHRLVACVWTCRNCVI
jgi:hypothetical protein